MNTSDGRTNGRTDGHSDSWMDGCIDSPSILQDIAMLTSKCHCNANRQGKGTADHLLSLGSWDIFPFCCHHFSCDNDTLYAVNITFRTVFVELVMSLALNAVRYFLFKTSAD